MANKIETQSKKKESGKNKENKPVENLTDAIVGVLNSLAKVKDLKVASEMMVKADQLKRGGNKVEAKELALKIFDQLKKVGDDANLPERSAIAALVTKGDYIGLAKLIEKQRKEVSTTTQAGLTKKSAEKSIEIEELLRAFEKEKQQILNRADADKLRMLPQVVAEKIVQESYLLANTESELNSAITEKIEQLVVGVGKETSAKERKALHQEWQATKDEVSFSGRSEISLHDVESVRQKMQTIWQEAVHDSEKIVKDIKLGAELDGATKRKIGKFERLIKSGAEDRGWAIAVAGKTKELAGLLHVVEDKLRTGISFEQVCDELSPKQVATVYEWIRALGKKPGQVGYDPVISGISQEILSDEEGKRLIIRFMSNIQTQYEESQQVQADNENLTRGIRMENVRGNNGPAIFDEFGRPHFGLREGASGIQQSGRDFLAAMSGDAEYVQAWFQAETEEEYRQLEEKRRSLYRAEMMNVSFDALMDDPSVPADFKKFLDVKSFEKGQVARLKPEYRNDPKAKELFQSLWLQEILYEQRMIAYEGVFQQNHQDARVTRYNTLMSIMDISTELKGIAKFQAQMYNMVDVQQNSYLDEEALSGLVRPWTAQGPDYRLEHLLKVHRENMYVLDKNGKKINIGNISLYDVVHKLKMRVEDPQERKELGMEGPDIPVGISRHYGTMMERHSESNLRTKDRKVVFFSLLKDRGVDLNSLTQEQKDWVFTRYQSYLDEGINYLWTHKQLHQAVGNASLKKGEYSLCQGLPEMLYKTDPKLVMDYFRIYSVGGASKDAFVFGDPGTRDPFTMAMTDYGNHLLFAETTTQGAPGIRDTFFGGKRDARTDEFVSWMGETMKESIFHNGYYDKSRPETMSTRMGSAKEIKSATRRPDAEIIDELKKRTPPPGFVEAIDWGTPNNPGVFAKIVVDPDLVKKLTDPRIRPDRKWSLFINRFGEDYLNMEAAAAKRVEILIKYGLQQHFKWYPSYLGWQAAPVNNTKAVEMMQSPAAVNSAIVPHLVDNFLEYQAWANESLGHKLLLGGKTRRIAKNSKGQIQFDTSYGFLGKDATGASEWPGMAGEELVNDSNFTDPRKKSSVNAVSGVAGYQDEFALKNLAEDFFRAGMMTEHSYDHWYKEDFAKSFFWAKKKGVILNMWNWVSGEVFFEYMGNVWFGIPGHMLREAWGEPTKEQLEHLWKYFSGGGGHGH